MEFIKKYWDTQAAKYKESHKASWQDNFAIDLEVYIAINPPKIIDETRSQQNYNKKRL